MFTARLALFAALLLQVIVQFVHSVGPLAIAGGISTVVDSYKLYNELIDTLNNRTFEDRVFQQFDDLNQHLGHVKSQLQLVILNQHKIGDQIARTTAFSSRLQHVQETLYSITSGLPNAANLSQFSLATTLKIADGLLDPNQGVRKQLRYLQLLVADDRPAASIAPPKLTNLMLESLQANELEQCSLGKTVQLALLEYYELVQLVRIRAAAAVGLSYWLKSKDPGNSQTSEAEDFAAEFREHTGAFERVWKAALSRADRRVWRCDPVEHREHQTYEQLEVFWTFMDYERKFNDMCSGTCNDISSAYITNNISGVNSRACELHRSDCQFLGEKLKVYEAIDATSEPYVQNENNVTYGHKTSRNLPMTEKSSYFSIPVFRCDWCHCSCRLNVSNGNVFLANWVMADYDNGFVVTGVRIHKDAQNAVVRLQIQVGRIGPLGRINQTSVHWQPLDDREEMQRFYGQSVSVDRIGTPADHVVVGVAFKEHPASVGLALRTSPFDWRPGQLDLVIRYELETINDQSNAGLEMPEPDVSTRSPIPSRRTASSGVNVDFVTTGVVPDLRRHTVPFLDVQEVVSQPAVPLSEIRLYHKGQPGYGGFIGAELFTVDVHSWIESS